MKFDRFTHKSREAVEGARRLAEKSQHQALQPEHLLFALLEESAGIVRSVFDRLGADTTSLRAGVADSLSALPRVSGSGAQLHLDPRLVDVFSNAGKEAKKLGDEYVSVEHLVLALLSDKATGELLKGAEVQRDAFLSALSEIRGSQHVTDEDPESKYEVLQKFTRDLTELAEQGKLDPVIGRDDEIRRVMQVLGRRTKNNPVLLGDPGVGKTAIVEGLARRIVAGDVPDGLKGTRVLTLDLGGPARRHEIPGRVRGALQGAAQGGDVLCGRDHPLHR